VRRLSRCGSTCNVYTLIDRVFINGEIGQMGNFFFSILLLSSYTYTHLLGVRWMVRRTDGWMMACGSGYRR
jgi:hypothetical protein